METVFAPPPVRPFRPAPAIPALDAFDDEVGARWPVGDAPELTGAALVRAAIAGAAVAGLACLLSGNPRLAVALGFANLVLTLVLERFKTSAS